MTEIARQNAAEDVPDGTSGQRAGGSQSASDPRDAVTLDDVSGHPWRTGVFLTTAAAVTVLAGALGAGVYAVTHRAAPGRHVSAVAASPVPGRSPAAGGHGGVQAPRQPAGTRRAASSGKPSAPPPARTRPSASPGSLAAPGSPAGGGTALSGGLASSPSAPAGTLSVGSASCSLISLTSSHACSFLVTAVGGPVTYSVAEPASETADYTIQIADPSGSLQPGQETTITLTVAPTGLTVMGSASVVVNPGSQTVQLTFL